MTDNQARNRPQIPVPPFPYTAEELCFESQGVSLCGTLTLPADSERFPGVVLVQGSGPHARDELVFGHPIFLVLADYLTRRGIAVLRYDKRGIGMSGGLYTESTVQDFADDALAALRFLKTKAQISQTGIVGHSEGGHVAMMVAAHSTDVDFIVSMAGMAVSGLDIHLSQLGLHLRNTKISEEIVGRELALARERIEILLAEPDNSAAAIKLLEFFRRNGKLLPTTKELIEAEIRALAKPWTRSFFGSNPWNDLCKVTCPFLALNGEKDTQVEVGPNLDIIRAAGIVAKNSWLFTVAIPGVNHLFQQCNTGLLSEYESIDETIAPEVLQLIADWILSSGRQDVECE